jgi:molecular chaperone DnaK (HSP70)
MTNANRAERAFRTLLGTYINRDGAADFDDALTSFLVDAMHEMHLHQGDTFDEILEKARLQFSEVTAAEAA